MLFTGRLDEAEAILRRAEAAVGDEPCASAELRGYLAPQA